MILPIEMILRIFEYHIFNYYYRFIHNIQYKLHNPLNIITLRYLSAYFYNYYANYYKILDVAYNDTSLNPHNMFNFSDIDIDRDIDMDTGIIIDGPDQYQIDNRIFDINHINTKYNKTLTDLEEFTIHKFNNVFYINVIFNEDSNYHGVTVDTFESLYSFDPIQNKLCLICCSDDIWISKYISTYLGFEWIYIEQIYKIMCWRHCNKIILDDMYTTMVNIYTNHKLSTTFLITAKCKFTPNNKILIEYGSKTIEFNNYLSN